MESRKFKAITLQHWRQFRDVSIDFGDSVTVLTGRNGTGKTTILNLLAQHSGYFTTFLGAPAQSRDSLGRYTSGLWGYSRIDPTQLKSIGIIAYSTAEEANITVPGDVAVDFSPQILPSLPVRVLNISSHRRLPTYKPVESIPTQPITDAAALSHYQKETWNAIRGNVSRFTPLSRMKEAIVSMAVFGLGNEIVAGNQQSFEVFKDFEERLRQIIPSNIGFIRLSVNVPDVIVETDTGSFLIDASSGGLMSLIDLAWQITLYGRQDPNFVVIIDEPENHLHPSMQREFLPALTKAFPYAQFIVATHSPFIVSSVRDAKVYAFDISPTENLEADDFSGVKNAVVTVPVDISNRTSANEVLRKVLGVPVTVPLWAETELASIAEQFGQEVLTADRVKELQQRLRQAGLDEFLPDAIARAMERNA